MGHLRETDIQWVVEWWHISSMVHNYCKDYYVTLVGLHCYSYSFTCRILRQFEEHQGAPNDEGAFHIEVFTNRILGRFREAWPCHRVIRSIAPPWYIYPTARYKQWLEDDMKWILNDKKAYMKTSKKAKRVEWPPWYASYFTFSHFMILMFLFLNLIKDWNVPNPLWKKILLSFNLSNKRITFFIIFASSSHSFIFFFSFFFSFSFAM